MSFGNMNKREMGGGMQKLRLFDIIIGIYIQSHHWKDWDLGEKMQFLKH